MTTPCGATCPKLGPGTKLAHCATCHETFSTPRSFDMHRPVTGPCRPPAEVGLVKNRRGVWSQPVYTSHAEDVEAMRHASG